VRATCASSPRRFRVNRAVAVERPFCSSVSSKATVAVAPQARSLRDGCRRQRAALRRRIGTASATDASLWGVYSAVRRLFAFMAHDTRRGLRRDGRADPTHAGCRSRACPGGAFSDVSGLSRMATITATRHRTGRTGHPSGSTLRNSSSGASSVYAFSDQSPSVATFEDMRAQP
jgi:hypothetical protein